LTASFEPFDATQRQEAVELSQTGSGIEGQPVTWGAGRWFSMSPSASGYGGVYSLFSGDERARPKVPTGGSLCGSFAVKN